MVERCTREEFSPELKKISACIRHIRHSSEGSCSLQPTLEFPPITGVDRVLRFGGRSVMRLLGMSPNTLMKLAARSFPIVAGVLGEHAFCANCRRSKAKLPCLRALCPFCVQRHLTRFDFPSFF